MSIEEIAKTYCSSSPSAEDWASQREVFTELGLKFYNSKINKPLPEHFRALERELERCYCAEAYISCIALSYSIVETFSLSLSASDRKTMTAELAYIDEELNWLRERRNDLTHFGRPSNKLKRVTSTEERTKLEGEARKAIGLVYHVARQFVRL